MGLYGDKLIKSNVPNKIIGTNNKIYNSIRILSDEIGVSRFTLSKYLNMNGSVTKDGITYRLVNTLSVKNSDDAAQDEGNGKEVYIMPREDDEEYEAFKKAKEIQSLPFENCRFTLKNTEKGSRYAIALFSDAHIEETVRPESVDFKNEYNIEIAEQRMRNYFNNLAQCLIKDEVDYLVFASLGDTISGYIHDELAQCNGLTPIEATYKAQNFIYNGLEFIVRTVGLKKIKFIGIVGNHSRTTKKIQHANGFGMSYEWLMYKNIEAQCKASNLPIEFFIPESEIAILTMNDNRKFIFAHGFQIKSTGNGTVCGIYPALNRLSMKWKQVFNQDKIYIGHFHSCVSIPNATVNGSLIGYNSFSLTNGFAYEDPAQMYEVYDSELNDLLLTRKIYCK